MSTPNLSDPSYHPPGPKPENHLVIAILATLFCCLPMGVVSLVHSLKVDSTYASGDYYQSVEYSESARRWANWAALTSVILVGVSLLGSCMLKVFGS